MDVFYLLQYCKLEIVDDMSSQILQLHYKKSVFFEI